MTIDLTTPSGRPTARNRPPAAALRGLAAGGVHLPGDPGYDAARLPWNVAVDQRAAAVAVPHTAAEVGAVVRVAAEMGLRVAPQSTGHNAGPLAAQGLDDVVVVRTSAMNTVIADPSRGIVRVEGGALWEPAVDAAAVHGQAVLHGSSPDVGIAGYSLGGGIGWYARKLGLATNSLTAVEIVIGDGTLVRADADDQPRDLLGGPRRRRQPRRGHRAGVPDVPDRDGVRRVPALGHRARREGAARVGGLGAGGAGRGHHRVPRDARMPPMPELPASSAAASSSSSTAPCSAPTTSAASCSAPAGAASGDGHLRPGPRRVAGPAAHGPRGRRRPFASDSAMLGSLPDAGVDAFLEQVGPGAQTSLLMAELRQLGGALGRRTRAPGCSATSTAEFVTFAGAIAATPEIGAQGHAEAVRLTRALAPWTNGKQYLNFAENPVDARAAYADGVWTQLKGIRSAVDPHGTFAANHPVPRTFENGSPTD